MLLKLRRRTSLHGKKNLFIALCAVFIFALNIDAQESNEHVDKIIQDYVPKEAKGLANSLYVITSQHQSSTSGIHHVYFSQAINGIPINGTESSVHILNGKSVKANVNLIPGELIPASMNRTPTISASQAVQSVAQKMNYAISSLQEVERIGGVQQKTTFNNAGISRVEIPAKLVYQRMPDNSVILAWELSIDDIHTPEDWWNFQVDASNGEIISKNNFIAQCEISHEHTHEVLEGPQPFVEKGSYYGETSSSMAGNYNVYAYPVESPHHGGRTLVADPDQDGTSSPFGWHDTNGATGAEFNDTRGNNIDAFNFNTNYRPSGGAGLTFNFGHALPPGSTALSQQDAALTNMFYWGNIMHDVVYEYGFNEDSGNFQTNNYGNGGSGGDSVIGEGLKTGTCNAFFGTPSDGNRPTMQMFICEYGGAVGDRDGDFDNGVIAHEYGHGISNRLTGGRFNVNCLNNNEQMGEGWSDYYGLVLTIEPGDDGTDKRGMGTWLAGQTSTGNGIRTQPYDTDTNTYTYNSINGASVPHGVGSVWAMMLWEMTWDLIAVHGFDADIYNGTGGNNIALALVTEGLKLQPCSPGFVDGRDAILAADMALYGGANQCTIWNSFATRGLGFSASQGSTASTADGTQAFDLPPAQLALTRAEACVSEGVITGLGGGGFLNGVYSGTGVSDDANGTTFSFDAAAAGIGSHIITFTQTCTGTTSTDTITVTDGIPTLTCENVTINLDGAGNASVTTQDVVAEISGGTGAMGYTVDQTGTFDREDISGTGTTVTLGDDAGTAAIPLGFDFDFFGTTYTSIHIVSNGWVSFTGNAMTGAPSYTPDSLPDAADPDGMVAVVWDDWSPNISGTIRHQVIGSAPNRIMIVDYDAVPHFNDAATTLTAQLKLFEGSNRVEIHTTNAVDNGGNRTQGIENAAGDNAVVTPSRNLSTWAATSDFVAYVPIGGSVPENCGNPVTVSLSQSDFTCADIGDNIITITADDGNGGIATCDATVTVVGPTVTYAAGVWSNGTGPDAGTKAMFDDNYDTADGNINACSCEVTAGNEVTVGAGEFMNITGDITVGGTLTVEHQGSVVQSLAGATVTNNGVINVEVTTPILGGRDFMIMGSPVTDEAREDALGAAFRVRRHLTDQFELNADVSATFGDAINFADENTTTTVNWVNHTGDLNPGEGYMVRPHTNGTGDATYDFVFNAGTSNTGTLNTGDVTYNTVIGPDGAGNGSPNMAANPYPSAISATAMMTANGLGEIYFWEHNTQPSNTFPGQYVANFTMGDISMINSAGVGNPAATGGATPTNVLSSMQGFGYKAPDADNITFTNAMRTTANNNTLRDGELNELDIARLHVMSTEYERGSTTTVAFLDEATVGLDEGLDNTRLANIVSIYTHLENGTSQFGIQSRETFSEDIKIPVGFSTMIEEQTTYRISLASFEGLNLTEATPFIIDNVTNTITNLNEGDLVFTSEKGRFDARFTLQFKSEDILNTSEVTSETITMYPNPAADILNIVSTRSSINKVTIYDVQGRQVTELVVDNEGVYQIDLARLVDAMYFVTIETEQGTVTKRLIKK